MNKTFLLLFMISTLFAIAQENILSALDTEEPLYVSSTFKGKKVVNGQSVELTSKGVLQFQIQHRFGTLNSGFYNLFGFQDFLECSFKT